MKPYHDESQPIFDEDELPEIRRIEYIDGTYSVFDDNGHETLYDKNGTIIEPKIEEVDDDEPEDDDNDIVSDEEPPKRSVKRKVPPKQSTLKRLLAKQERIGPKRPAYTRVNVPYPPSRYQPQVERYEPQPWVPYHIYKKRQLNAHYNSPMAKAQVNWKSHKGYSPWKKY
jgi:hypothetical protein